MPTAERVASPDRDIKHQHSFSDSGKLHVPMWDSSDPDRCPPPLPLNPGTPNTSPTKANTSANVAAAAQALVERARENMGASPYIKNSSSNGSPEKSPTKTPQHKRLQSLQNVNTKDLRSSYENSIERPLSRSNSVMSSHDVFSSSPERTPSRAGSSTPTPNAKETKKDGTNGKSNRPPPRPILGENTPASSTMLALQSMRVRDEDYDATPPLRDITNSSTPKTPNRPSESVESQLMNLTTIANALQKEMTNLSRRSKDNAADLISLKDATKTRDEDIRKSLRELINGTKLSEAGLFAAPPRIDQSRSNSALGISQHLLDNKPHSSPPFAKSVSLPRIPPAAGMENEYDRASSPSPFSIESTASVAMLEKIIREMGTKEGQERLLSNLSELMEKSSKESDTATKKIEELIEIVRDRPDNSKALVRHKERHISFEDDVDEDQDLNNSRGVIMSKAGPNSGALRNNQSGPSAIVIEELKKMVQKVKDGVAQGGGMTGEVKSLVRDLRGEVLGMGRELAQRLDRMESSGGRQSGFETSREDLSLLVQDGLADLKQQMDQVIQSRRRQSASSSITRNSVDSSEVYAVVKHALAEHGLDQPREIQAQNQVFDQDAILTAVKDAFETYKPDFELQQFGLERDEILQCLKEGLEDYQGDPTLKGASVLSKEDVLEAVQEGLRHFTPPQPPNELTELKEEILMSVRECLEDFKPAPKQKSWKPGDISREEILDAVKEGLGEHKKEGARQIDINKDDLFGAVKAGLENREGLGSSLLGSLEDIVAGMRVEFMNYSAANGRDTEQVLDAMKDGLESLRTEIESYVDRAQDVTGKDEIIDALKEGLQSVQGGIEEVAEKADRTGVVQDTSELTDYIKSEFEHVHDVIAKNNAEASAEKMKEELLMAVTIGFQQLKSRSSGRDIADLPEESLEALKVEFEQLRDSILDGSATHKEELLDALRDGLKGFQSGAAMAERNLDSNYDIINAIREEFTSIRESFNSQLLYAGASDDKEAVLSAVRESLDNIRIQVASDQNDAANEAMGAIREELEQLRESFSNALVPGSSAHDKEEILEIIRQGLGSVNNSETRDTGNENSSSLDFIKDELERLRQSMETSLVPSAGQATNEDMLETIRLGIESLRSQVELGGTGERSASSNSELIDTLNDSLDNLRIDVAKMVDKPVDMTMSTEILDTLKDGLSGLRADMDFLRAGVLKQDDEVVLADGSVGSMSKGMHKHGSVTTKDDLHKLEVILTQLQIKVEAMDQNMHGSANMFHQSDGPSSKQDFTRIESTLAELQAAITGLSIRESGNTTGVTKEDTDAIETLLYNTKAKIEDSVLPGVEAAVTKEQFEEVETVVRSTQQTIENLAANLGSDTATKDDVAALAHLVDEASTSLKSMRERFETDEDKVTKTDVEVIGDICTEIKTQIDDLPSLGELPSKADVEQLTELLHDFRESHNTLKDRYDADIEITAKAFDDRKEEAKTIMDQMNELKDLVDESKNELKSRMRRGNEDVRALDEILQGIEDKIDESPNAVPDVRELTDIVNREFERAHEAIDKVKSSHQESSSTISQSYEMYSKAIIEDLTKRLDDRFAEIMRKHDEQLAKHEEIKSVTQNAARSVESRASQQEDLLAGSRAMAEELKVSIDTLGASVTAVSPALAEATDKMSDDAKTVFNKVDEMATTLDNNFIDYKTEHQLTREEIIKCLAASGTLHELLTGFQPKALDALGKLISMVEQHYEHSRKADESARENHDRTLNHVTSSFASIPKLEAAPVGSSSSSEKYDDTELQRKLNTLLDQSRERDTSTTQHEKIDDIHQQVKESAAEISAFVEFQTKLITAEHENKEREANQAAMDLSRFLSEKDTLEASIVELRELKQSVSTDIDGLKAEQEDLGKAKTRLTGEVSSLETALKIRREELQTMDSRADALEQRILERVMDHSRALLLGKAPKRSVNLNLKRVSSNASNSTVATTVPSAINAATGMALKSRSTRKPLNNTDPAARRIHSLSQITSNVPTGAKGFASAPRNLPGGLTNLKRSQSVKNPSNGLNNPQRSQSVRNPVVRNAPVAKREILPDYDKENDILSEGSDREADESGNNTAPSTANRSTSYAGSHLTQDEQALTNRRPRHSLDSSLYAYDSISNFTGSDMDRRTSIGSTIRTNAGIISSLEDSIHEDDEDEYEDSKNSVQRIREDDQLSISEDREAEEEDYGEGHDENRLLEASNRQLSIEPSKQEDLPRPGLILRTDGYDSGLGSDLPTADLSASGHHMDYFKSLNEV